MKNKISKKIKIIVAHPAQQHSYRTATALKKQNMLFKYITTVYSKKHSLLMKIVKVFLGESNLKRANGRRCGYLDDVDVKQFYEARGFFELLLMRININLYNIWSRNTTNKFGKKIAKYAIKNKVDAVIMYDTKAEKCFEILKKKAPNIKRVLDMSAPNLEFMDLIFKNDITVEGDKDNLNKEFNTLIYKKNLESAIREIKLTHSFLVASEFSKMSLVNYGIDNKKIYICQYGIDMNIYKSSNTKINKFNKINLLFVGRATQKKGFFYLMDAINGLDMTRFSFTIVGNYNEESDYYKKYKDIYNFVGFVTKDELIEYYSNADVLIFPSLADGFGLSVLEGLSCGLPVICSCNAGVSDLIINGYNGFVVSAADSNSIREKILWFGNNICDLEKMKNNAKKTAQICTWEKYNNNVTKAIKEIIK